MFLCKNINIKIIKINENFFTLLYRNCIVLKFKLFYEKQPELFHNAVFGLCCWNIETLRSIWAKTIQKFSHTYRIFACTSAVVLAVMRLFTIKYNIDEVNNSRRSACIVRIRRHIYIRTHCLFKCSVKIGKCGIHSICCVCFWFFNVFVNKDFHSLIIHINDVTMFMPWLQIPGP